MLRLLRLSPRARLSRERGFRLAYDGLLDGRRVRLRGILSTGFILDLTPDASTPEPMVFCFPQPAIAAWTGVTWETPALLLANAMVADPEEPDLRPMLGALMQLTALPLAGRGERCQLLEPVAKMLDAVLRMLPRRVEMHLAATPDPMLAVGRRPVGYWAKHGTPLVGKVPAAALAPTIKPRMRISLKQRYDRPTRTVEPQSMSMFGKSDVEPTPAELLDLAAAISLAGGDPQAIVDLIADAWASQV